MAVRLTPVEIAVLDEILRRGGSENVGAPIATNRDVSATGFMVHFERSQAVAVDRERFPDRVYVELYGILDDTAVGFLVFFEDFYVEAIEGHALWERCPQVPKKYELVSKEEAEKHFRENERPRILKEQGLPRASES